tara:strand:+ start:6443 stop:6673 length:231 start_codon:yes stop_codon:yes gene_type:complete
MQALSSLDASYRQILYTTEIVPKSLALAKRSTFLEFSEKIKVSIKKVYHEVALMREASLVVDGLFSKDNDVIDDED